MFKVALILFIFSFNSFAEGPHPIEPTGWVEMHSIEPVILTWVKASPDKELEEVPTFMVQKYPKSEKFQQFIRANRPDASGCFEITNKEWTQTWCVREKSVLTLMTKGVDESSARIKATLRAWVLTHE